MSFYYAFAACEWNFESRKFVTSLDFFLNLFDGIPGIEVAYFSFILLHTFLLYKCVSDLC